MEQLFGGQLQSKSGLVTTNSLSAKYKLIYFSAQWGLPCRIFTPQLVLFYEQVNASSHQVDIVYVSLDRTQDEFDEHYSSMPWLALPFADRQKAQTLRGQVTKLGIPSLFLIDNQGRMKMGSRRDDVRSKGPRCLALWDRILNK